MPNLRRIRECIVRFALLGGSDCTIVQFVPITVINQKNYIFLSRYCWLLRNVANLMRLEFCIIRSALLMVESV